MDEVHQITEGD